MGCIYAIQHLASGKVYVGQTVKPSWRDRYVCQKPQIHPSQRLLHRAVNAHKLSEFRFENLMIGILDDQLDFWEKFWIRALGSCDRSLGYNLESGGRTQKSINMETRELMRRSMIGKNKGKKYPSWNEARRKRYIHEHHPMYRPMVWEHPEKGRFIGGGKQLAEAFPQQNLTRGNISKVAHGLRHHTHGWICLGDYKPTQN